MKKNSLLFADFSRFSAMDGDISPEYNKGAITQAFENRAFFFLLFLGEARFWAWAVWIG